MAIAPSPSLLLLCIACHSRCGCRGPVDWLVGGVDYVFRRMYPYAIEQRNHVQFASLGRLYSTYSLLASLRAYCVDKS